MAHQKSNVVNTMKQLPKLVEIKKENAHADPS